MPHRLGHTDVRRAAAGVRVVVRAGRGVIATDADHAFAEHAAESLRALDDAASSVGEFTAMRSGGVALGTFSAPSTWRLEELVAAFLERHPNLIVRFMSRNSSAITERVRRGELEAGVVLLPIDDDRLDVRPLVRDEALYVNADPERTRRPATIKRLASAPLIFCDAESADSDPIRRCSPSAQAHGLRLRVEVEMAELALALVARGIGDTYLPVSYTHAPYYPAGLTTAPFTPALFNTFAIVTRPPRDCRPGHASCWPSSSSTCTPWRTSSTARGRRREMTRAPRGCARRRSLAQ